MVDQSLLVNELGRFARILVTDYPVSDALHDFVETAAAILGIHGAGMSLARDGRLGFATATPADIAALEKAQEETQLGPCVDAHRSQRPVLVEDIRVHHERWPTLTDVASRTGIVAVGSIPLRLSDVGLGTLDLYDTDRRRWTDEEADVAELLAALAAGYLANASRLDRARQTADQLQEALDSRVIIEQAKGLIAGERGISVDEAFHVLRAHARNRGASLREVAHAVVELGLRP
jgi:GAF domain-containing protein